MDSWVWIPGFGFLGLDSWVWIPGLGFLGLHCWFGFLGLGSWVWTPGIGFLPWSPVSNISHHDRKTIGRPPNIVSWSECRLEFPDDADGDGDAPTLFPSDQTPIPLCAGMKETVR